MPRLSATAKVGSRLAVGAATLACTLVAGVGRAAAVAPTLRITSPAEGSFTRESSPDLAGGLEPNEGVWCVVTVDVYEGTVAAGTPVQQLFPEPSEECGSWHVAPAAPLAQGSYTIRAKERRWVLISGHEVEELPEEDTSRPVTFTVDTTAPSPAIVSPVSGATYTTGTIPVSGAAGTASGDERSVVVDVYAGADLSAAPLESVEMAAPGASWSGAIAGLPPGSYVLRAEQSDRAGNLGLSQPVAIAVAPPGPSPPPVASFGWFPSTPQAGEPVTLASTSVDAASPITGYSWSLAQGEALRSGQPTLTTSFATPGPHVVRLQVRDANGLTSTATQTILVRHRAATLIQPFPIVRIAGRQTSSGVRLSLLTVEAPVSARVTVRIRGAGRRIASGVSRIARSKQTSGSVLMSFPRFARPIAAGSTLEVSISKAGQIGKLTRLIPRAGRLPTRQDLCLSPAGKPMRCPAA